MNWYHSDSWVSDFFSFEWIEGIMFSFSCSSLCVPNHLLVSLVRWHTIWNISGNSDKWSAAFSLEKLNSINEWKHLRVSCLYVNNKTRGSAQQSLADITSTAGEDSLSAAPFWGKSHHCTRLSEWAQGFWGVTDWALIFFTAVGLSCLMLQCVLVSWSLLCSTNVIH